jgi:hypothetical protein
VPALCCVLLTSVIRVRKGLSSRPLARLLSTSHACAVTEDPTLEVLLARTVEVPTRAIELKGDADNP